MTGPLDTDAARRWRRRFALSALVAGIVFLALSPLVALAAYRFFAVPWSQTGFAEQEIRSALAGSAGPHDVDEFDRVEAAKTIAVEFSQEYLTLDPEEDEDLAVERIDLFVHPRLDAAQLTPAPPVGSRQWVLSSRPIHVRVADGDAFEVRTRNRVLVEPLEDETDGGEERDEERDEEEGPSPEIKQLAVYVAVDDRGRAAVVDPPTLMKPSGLYEGEAGVLDFEGAERDALDPGGELETRLQGYFSALYGRAESRETLETFFVPGATPPAEPPDELEFVEISSSALRPRKNQEGEFVPEEHGGTVLPILYDAEVWVAVRAERGPSAGMVLIQTHLLTVGQAETGEWLIVGDR